MTPINKQSMLVAFSIIVAIAGIVNCGDDFDSFVSYLMQFFLFQATVSIPIWVYDSFIHAEVFEERHYPQVPG